MTPPARGNVIVKTLADGTRVFKLRFRVHGQREMEVLHERRDCKCGCGGGWNDRTAQIELQNTLARVKVGVWRKRKPPPPVSAARIPTFHEYASKWLEDKKAGLLGDRPIGPHTEADYRSRLRIIFSRSSGSTASTRSARMTASSSKLTSSRKPQSFVVRSRRVPSSATAMDAASGRWARQRSASSSLA